jgi:hypothetical protein
MTKSRSQKIADKLMKLMKEQITSSSDIISFNELPFFSKEQLPNYIIRFGIQKIKNYLMYREQICNIRDLNAKLLPIYDKKYTAINSLFKVATTLCGYGECDETSQRAAIEFLAMGCEDAVNLVVLKGKPKIANPIPNNLNHFYIHMIVVIGSLEGRYHENVQKFFGDLPDSYILFDPSLKLMGPANKAVEILASMFKHYKIRWVEQVSLIQPAERIAYAKAKLDQARELSEVIKKELNIITNIKPMHRERLFSYPEKEYRNPESKPISLLLDENNKLDWETCMQKYHP